MKIGVALRWILEPVVAWFRRRRAAEASPGTTADAGAVVLGAHALRVEGVDSPPPAAAGRWSSLPWGPDAATTAEIDAAQAAFAAREAVRAGNANGFARLARAVPPGVVMSGTITRDS